jgi:Dolichyl-phosphate-mannose-protein mannosyltransferase
VPHARFAWRFTAVLAVVSFLITLWDLTFGGFRVSLFGIRISSWELYRPVLAGAMFTALALYIHDRFDVRCASWNAPARTWRSIAGAVAIGFFTLAVSLGTFVTGGADGYGYVSQSQLWLTGRIIETYPIAHLAPQLGDAVAPIGYRLAQRGGRIVPTYAPGLPLTMAVGAIVGGANGTYLVVPLLGGLAVFLTYALGARVADPRTGCVAAVLLAISPLFLFHAMVPMSDVPATAWWLLAWLFALRGTSASAIAAGLAASAALLTRPNLLPVALDLAVIISIQSGWRRSAIFAASVVPSCLGIGTLNQLLYGSPFESGYGTVERLFRTAYLVPNLTNYARSLLQLHTPLIILAIVAPVWGTLSRSWSMLAFCGVVLGCYVFYTPFEHWTFLRFLLPAIPVLLILCSSVLMRSIAALPLPCRGAAVAIVCILAPYWALLKAGELGIFNVQRNEQRYALVGSQVERFLPPDAVVLSLNHSGSLRLYGHRQTLRWDLIEPDRLGTTIDVLREHGYTPFVALDEFEEGTFRDRFSRASAVGRLDWPPALEYPGPIRVRVYALSDRDQHLVGARIVPRMIPPS